MGYTTDFKGSFTLDRPLTADQKEYLNMFADTRRMTRDPVKLQLMKDSGKGNRRCFELLAILGLPLGEKGDFYCGTGMAGQDGGHFNSSTDNSVVEYNTAPGETKWGDLGGKSKGGQPGLWCQWNPSEDGTEIAWDGSEKFYNYIEWIQYLIATFLAPWGYKVNGEVVWQGEDTGDVGVIEIVDNEVYVHEKVVEVPEKAKYKKMTESAIAASEAFAESKSNAPIRLNAEIDVVLEIVKIRNACITQKAGTRRAAKMLDKLIERLGGV